MIFKRSKLRLIVDFFIATMGPRSLLNDVFNFAKRRELSESIPRKTITKKSLKMAVK